MINRIAVEVSETRRREVGEKGVELNNLVKDWYIPVEKEEVKSMSKLGDNRIAFADKVAQYAVTNPEFLPPYADVEEYVRDLKAYKDLREIVRPIRQITDNLETSMKVSGSEAYEFARSYYRAVQYHAKMGVPGAQTILDDLRTLFEAKSSPETDEQES
ncbi:MAG: hypothetical protein LUM44_19570 [Pyrinomonadaceae bacterium]|nr:hypothetical protein [Pyrinomonadaceae bacterium]